MWDWFEVESMIELFIVALVLEICRQVTLYRLYGKKITVPVKVL